MTDVQWNTAANRKATEWSVAQTFDLRSGKVAPRFKKSASTHCARYHPPMKMIALQSGSNGNGIYKEMDGVRLLFDARIIGRHRMMRSVPMVETAARRVKEPSDWRRRSPTTSSSALTNSCRSSLQNG